MAVGKYRYAHMWETSETFGPHEELLLEGAAAGSSWAVVRRWYPHPTYGSGFHGEKYIFRMNLSEWWNAYGKCYADATRLAFEAFSKKKPLEGVIRRISMDNRSPGYWEDGYGVSFYFSSTVVQYPSEEDRIKAVAETGRDWDTVDYDTVVYALRERLKPVFDLFAKWGKTGAGNSF